MRASIIGLLLAMPILSTPGDTELAQKADAEFALGVRERPRFLVARKHFAAAADSCLELHERGVRSAALYRAMGNALALSDRWPEAIWAYQMGLALDPNDRAIRRHLSEMRTKVMLPPDGQGRLPADGWPSWLIRPTAWDYWLISVFSYSLLFVAIAGWRLTRCRRWRFVAGVALVVACSAVLGLWLTLQQQQSLRGTPVAVVLDNTPFLRGNARNYPPHPSLPTLPRGLEVRVFHRRGGWLQIGLSTGEIGWIPASSVWVVH